MENAVKKAYAKINVTLDVLGRREDGYHLVKMIMQSVNLYDVLTFEKTGILESNKGKVGKDGLISLSAKNPDELDSLVTMDENNLIYKAAKLLYDRYDIKEPVHITLEKNIPVAAGLAGGSTDAAATFKGINELFNLGLSVDEMAELGAGLGADIPYCIKGGTMLSEGIGEVLTKLPDFPGVTFVLAKPECPVSTKEVYEGIDAYDIKDGERPDTDRLIELLCISSKEKEVLENMAECMANVLELVTVPLHPEIGTIRDIMKENGAVRAMMSGSGPTVFGIFTDKEKAWAAEAALSESGLVKELFVTGNAEEN